MDYNYSSFTEFNLDLTLYKALEDLNFVKPTDVQCGVYPLVLQKKNLIVGTRTGSGKTIAYMLPIVQDVINARISENVQRTSTIILCPYKELCAQTKTVLDKIVKYTELITVNVSETKKIQSLKLLMNPDFIISTPSQLLNLIKEKLVELKHVRFMVIDEADLMFGYGYREALQQLMAVINVGNCQFTLLSATLSPDLLNLKKLINVKWFVIELEENSFLPSASQLTQYVKRCDEDDKYDILVSMLKFRLIQGKIIIFANTIYKCYKLKFMLDSFFIRCALLNFELPANCRNNIISQFNSGKHDILIVCDDDVEVAADAAAGAPSSSTDDVAADTAVTNTEQDESENVAVEKLEKNTEMINTKSKKSKKQSAEFSVSRGIDFFKVNVIINFDCPLTVDNYIHRVGRTARNEEKGSAVTFVNKLQEDIFQEIESFLTNNGTEKDLFRPFNCPKSVYEGMKYRIQDVRNRCTRVKIDKLRIADIQTELKNSATIKAHFKSNPDVIEGLCHNEVLTDRSADLKKVPTYLLPKEIQKKVAKTRNKKSKKPRKKGNGEEFVNKVMSSGAGAGGKQKKQNDPLYSFKMKKRNKK